MSFFLKINPLKFFCNFIILNIVLHHSCIKITLSSQSLSPLSFIKFFFIVVAYSNLLINTAVLCASFNSFFLYPLANPVLFMPSFFGIGVKEFSGSKVTILLALFFIFNKLSFKQFSKFCGLFNEFLLWNLKS